MATQTKFVQVGVGVVSIGAWATGGGAGTGMTDVGHLKAPCTLAASIETYDVKSESVWGIIKSVPTDMKVTLKVPELETSAENLRVALGQPAANKTGTGDNLTLLVGKPPEQYHQVTIVSPGPGTNATRTWTFWRCRVTSMGELAFGKTTDTAAEITLEVLYDDTVTTADKFFKFVDT